MKDLKKQTLKATADVCEISELRYYMKLRKTALILAMTLVLGACGKSAQGEPVPSPEPEVQQAQDDTATVTPAEETDIPEKPQADPEPEPDPEPAEEEPLTFIEDMGTTTINGYTVKPVCFRIRTRNARRHKSRKCV